MMTNTLVNMQYKKSEISYKKTGDKNMNRAISVCKYELKHYKQAIVYNAEIVYFMVREDPKITAFACENYFVLTKGLI